MGGFKLKKCTKVGTGIFTDILAGDLVHFFSVKFPIGLPILKVHFSAAVTFRNYIFLDFQFLEFLALKTFLLQKERLENSNFWEGIRHFQYKRPIGCEGTRITSHRDPRGHNFYVRNGRWHSCGESQSVDKQQFLLLKRTVCRCAQNGKMYNILFFSFFWHIGC